MSEAWRKQLALIEKILHAWFAYELPVSKVKDAGSRADIIRTSFPNQFNNGLLKNEIAELVDSVSRGNGNDTRSIGGYIVVPPVAIGNPTLFPLLNVAVRVVNGDLYLALRVVTFYQDTLLECTDAHGWRFDMADPPNPSEQTRDSHHSFPHVQRITGWLPSAPSFFPPGMNTCARGSGYGENMSGPLLNESRPAFPLPVRSPAGLLVAAMGSLYGSSIAQSILENVPQRTGDFRKEVSEILRS